MAGEIDFAEALIGGSPCWPISPKTPSPKNRQGHELFKGCRDPGAHQCATPQRLCSSGFRRFQSISPAWSPRSASISTSPMSSEIEDGRLTGRLVGAILDQRSKANALNHLAAERSLTPPTPSSATALCFSPCSAPPASASPIATNRSCAAKSRSPVNHADLTALLFFQGTGGRVRGVIEGTRRELHV